MKQRYLEVTFRRGKPLAAYLYLPRALAAKAARTTDEGCGLRVDFDANGTPIGVEITAPQTVTIAEVNAVLTRLGLLPLPADEWAPLQAA
jgi:hypothetical protein